MTFAPYVAQLRPRQWTKNLILFAGIIFAERLLDGGLLLRALFGFGAFCLVSSAIYCFNDLLDVEHDRRHPTKRNRPLPSGRIRPGAVAVLGGALLSIGLGTSLAVEPAFAIVVGIYFVINIGYSIRLKEVAIVDLILLATGFVLRAVGSVEVLGRPEEIEISPWLLLCTFFLALFIGAGKRRAELALLRSEASEHRAALAGYSVLFLDRILTTALTASVLAYAIYTLAPETREKFGTHELVYTVPFVVFGLFRYLYLAYEREAGGNPTEAILHDRAILWDVVLWVLTVCYILYLAP